jgi:transcriptional regulator with XRE-family HTH domain
MDRLKKLRETKGLNQQGLAMKLGLSQSTISFYETGERKPDLEALIQLADFFGVSIDYLIGRSNIKRSQMENDHTAEDINFFHEFLKLDLNQKELVRAYMLGLKSQGVAMNID